MRNVGRSLTVNIGLIIVSFLFIPGDSHAEVNNPVLYWNDYALNLIKTGNVPPPKASRILGLMHLSVLEAANSKTQLYKPYDHAFEVTHLPSVLMEQAAAQVLRSQFPVAATEINQKLMNRIGDLNDQGGQVADHIMDKNPLHFAAMEEATPVDGFEWEPTAPQHVAYLLPEWCALRPLGVESVKKYRKTGPPSSLTEKFKLAIEETRRLGGKDSAVRTQDQTQIALFWADGRGTVTPPGHWNRIAAKIIQAKKMSAMESAKVMALLNMALADAAISAWDMKYKYQFARPMNLFESEGWEPLIVTPPFPEYVSGHSTFSGAAAEVLTELLGNVAFTTTSDGLPGVERSFKTFESAAQEAGRSRIYGGIHFSFSDDDGRQIGREIAKDIVQKYFVNHTKTFEKHVGYTIPCDGTCVIKVGLNPSN